MKKRFLFLLLIVSTQVEATRLPTPTVCRDNGWAHVLVHFTRDKNDPKTLANGSVSSVTREFCRLPNGIYSSPWDLEENKKGQYKELLKNTLVSTPHLLKDGFIVD